MQGNDDDDLFENAGLEVSKLECAQAQPSSQSVSFEDFSQSDTTSQQSAQSKASKLKGFGSKLLSVFKKKEV